MNFISARKCLTGAWERFHEIRTDSKLLKQSLSTALRLTRKGDFKEIYHRLSRFGASPGEARNILRLPTPMEPYKAWLRVNQWNEKTESYLDGRLANLNSSTRFSILIMQEKDGYKMFEKSVSSLLKQIYPHWRLYTIPNGSFWDAETLLEDQKGLEAFREKIKYLPSPNQGENHPITQFVQMADGEFLIYMKTTDILSRNALAEVALYIETHPDTDFIYFDDDMISMDGIRSNPRFKPDWSPELLLAMPYAINPIVARREFFLKTFNENSYHNEIDDDDIALHITGGAKSIGHLPLVLNHQIDFPVAPPRMASQRNYAPHFLNDGPSIALLIITNNTNANVVDCIKSIQKSLYTNYKIYLVTYEKEGNPISPALINEYNCDVIHIRQKSSSPGFSSLANIAASQIKEDYIIFLNSSVRAINEDWLTQLAGYAQRDGVGAAGCRILDRDGRILSAGLVIGDEPALLGYAFKDLRKADPGYLSMATSPRTCSAVSGACMITSRSVFLESGGFDETMTSVDYASADYCLRLATRGMRTVICANTDVLLTGAESDLGDDYISRSKFREKHSNREDPWRNPNLSPENAQFKIHPRRLAPKQAMPPIRTLMFTPGLRWEGAPLSQFELTSSLKKLNVIDPIIVSPENGPLRDRYEKEGIPVHIIDFSFTKILSLADYEKAIADLSTFIHKEKIGLLHANTLQTFYAVEAAHLAKVPSIWNPRESEPWQTYFDYLHHSIQQRALSCFKLPYRVVFVSRASRKAWSRLESHHNFMVVPNGLDQDAREDEMSHGSRDDARRMLSLEKNDVAVLLLGTVCERKGQRDLPKALRMLSEDALLGARFYLIGDRSGVYSDNLKRDIADLPAYLKDKINVIPEVGDVTSYLRAADIFLMTSRVESYPRVILEAMFFGLPIITTPVFGVSEQVQQGVNSIFYSPGDTVQLSQALSKLINDKDERLRLAGNSRNVLSSLINFDGMVIKYEQIFKEAFLSN